MAKVSINIIKDWFKNQMKPPQEQFWAWLDSFWHKDEPIPQAAVKDLVTTLQKKADLVDGVVPEEQLPFSVVTSEVLSLGKVEVVADKVNLSVHSSGVNKVRVKGQLISRSFPNQWTITPIVADGTKVLRGYAVKNEPDFFLAEGPELPNIEDPEIPPEALEIFKITMNATGVVVSQNDAGYKNKSDDTIAPIILNNDTATWIFGDRTNYDITATGLVTAPILAGFKYADSSPAIWNGKKSIIRNRTGFPLLFKKVTPPADTLIYFPFKQDYTIADGKDAQVIYDNNNEVALIEIGGGSELPPGTDGQIYVIDNSLPEKIKPSDRLTAAEVAITTEANARIAADKIETVVIALSPYNEDLTDNVSRLGFGVLTFPLKVLSFQTSAFPVPTGSGITTDLRKNGTSVATSVISAGATNSTGNPPPTFSADTFAIGDRLNFFTPTGGVGSTVKGQNLVATLIIERL